MQSQSLEVAGQAGWDIERTECDRDHLDWLRRVDHEIQIGRVDAAVDGTLSLHEPLLSVKKSHDETLDRWGRASLTGVMSLRNPQDSPKDPLVEWTLGPTFVASMQMRGKFLCVEDRVEVPWPPPCGNSFRIVRVFERHESGWVLLATIRRTVDSWPKFEATEDRWFLLTQGEGGLELWSGEPGGGCSGARLAKAGVTRDCGLSISNGRPVVAWVDWEGHSFVDWKGERIALPGVELDGRLSCGGGEPELGLLQCRSGLPIVVQVGSGSSVACCRYPAQREGKPIVILDGEDVIVWWLDSHRVVRDRIRIR